MKYLKYFIIELFTGRVGIVLFLYPFPGYAQGPPGIPEFQQFTGEMYRYYFSFSDLVLALGALSGMIGGLRVYANLQKGKHHMDGQVEGWLFSCLFLNLLAVVLKAVFGIR